MKEGGPGFPVILFDGDCALCQASVRFVLRHDRRALFRFAPLGSKVVRPFLRQWFPDGNVPDTVMLWHRGRLCMRSSAVLGMLSLMPFPWPILLIFKIMPVFLLDMGYRIIARLRNQFPHSPSLCLLPDPEHRDRFLY